MQETDKIYLNSLLPRTEDCDYVVSEFAADVGMSAKNALRVSLLTEETVGMICSMVDEFEAELWLEGDSHSCLLHLDVISESTPDGSVKQPYVSGLTNAEQPRGFMAKIGETMKCMFRFDNGADVPEAFADAIPTYMRYGITRDSESPLMIGQWSLSGYKQALAAERRENADADAALKELEKSIVASIADDVTIGIADNRIKLVIAKRFDK